MKRTAVRLCSIVIVFATASWAAAQGSAGVHLGIAGGATFPTEDTKDVYDTGYHGSVMLNFNAPVAPIGLRIEGMYSRMDEKDVFGRSGKVQIGSGTANLVLGPRAIVFRPYLIGGGGWYHLKFSSTRIAGDFEDTQNKFGWNAGGGISFGVGPVGAIFVEARYIRIETDLNFATGSHLTMIPVTVGFVF